MIATAPSTATYAVIAAIVLSRVVIRMFATRYWRKKHEDDAGDDR